MDKLYSLGTVVKLGDSPINITIVGYYPIDENGETFDYIGVNAIMGVTFSSDMLLFNHTSITEKLFEGYADQHGKDFLVALHNLQNAVEKENAVD